MKKYEGTTHAAWICRFLIHNSYFIVAPVRRTGTVSDRCRMPAAEFDALLAHLPAELANRWYKLDENSVCPQPDGTGPDKGVYVRQSRAGVRNWADEVEGPLGDAFRHAARAVGLPEAVRGNYDPPGNMYWRSSRRCALRRQPKCLWIGRVSLCAPLWLCGVSINDGSLPRPRWPIAATKWIGWRRQHRRSADKLIPESRIDLIRKVVPGGRALLLPSERFSDDSGGKWDEQRTNVRKEGWAQPISGSAIVQVNPDQPTALLNRALDLVFHKYRLRVRVVADQQDEGIGASDLRGAHRLDVVGRLRIDRLIKLEIGEIEVDVFVGFPGAHQIVSAFVSAAKAYEGSR